jgi:hypothetical protein
MRERICSARCSASQAFHIELIPIVFLHLDNLAELADLVGQRSDGSLKSPLLKELLSSCFLRLHCSLSGQLLRHSDRTLRP